MVQKPHSGRHLEDQDERIT